MKQLSLLFVAMIALVFYLLWEAGKLRQEALEQSPAATAKTVSPLANQGKSEPATDVLSEPVSPPDLAVIARDYFAVYAKRQDFNRFMGFYAQDATLEDMIYGHFAIDKQDIAEFLDWSKPGFEPIDEGPILEITEQIIQDRRVITRGYFTRFRYYGEELGPWRFVIWLEFNQEGKIRRHIDWINYTPRRNYLGGEDRNKNLTDS